MESRPLNVAELFIAWDWTNHNKIFVVTLLVFIVLASLDAVEKCGLAKFIPESLMLIFFGLVLSSLIYLTDFSLTIPPEAFFHYLLPPIILHSSYRIFNRIFIGNLDGVIMFAVLGTLLNTLSIGFALFGACGPSAGLSALQCLLLATIISAVDPVAVLSVFDEVGVKTSLYFLVFGESLFNDGVTVVLFDSLKKIAFEKNVEPLTYFYVGLSFFTVGLGGFLIGVFHGLLGSVFTKYVRLETKDKFQPHSKHTEYGAMVIILLAYMAFLNAEIFNWSGIMALIGVGVVQKRYLFTNVGEDVVDRVDHLVGNLARLTETVIFISLGFGAVKSFNHVDWELGAYAVLFCLIFRFLYTFLLGTILNTFRLHRLSMKELFVIAYGGLRGAVSYVMAASMSEHMPNLDEEMEKKFLATTLVVILFTVFIQGGTMKIIIKLFGFREKPTEDTHASVVMEKVSFSTLSGLENILGGGGTQIHHWMCKLDKLDAKYVQPWLCREQRHNEIHSFIRQEKRNGNISEH